MDRDWTEGDRQNINLRVPPCAELRSSGMGLPRNTSSAPIEIPRRRPNSSQASSPSGRQMSPDLIFEMSPLSSDFASVSRPGLTDAVINEPFMYPFPKISPHRIHTKPRRLLQPLQQSFYSENETLPPFDPVFTECNRPSPALRSKDNDQNITAPSQHYSTARIHKSLSCSTVKITGFTPATPTSVEAHGPSQSKPKRLSPPPRTSSYSSSPWILPGRSDAQPVEGGSLEIDPGSCEFDRHLMRRIENQDSRRFRKISLMSLIRA